MKFLQTFFISALASAIIYFGLVLIMIDAPIPAEYWVGEMITIKKYLVKQHTGEPKLIIAGGSSTLFGIDAEYASQQLKIPVINFGLHAGLPLGKILKEVSDVAEPDDLIVLPLEPAYYNCNMKMSSWNIENIIGWDHESWASMSFYEKAQFVNSVSFGTFGQMLIATAKRQFYPSSISKRLNSLDPEIVMSSYISRPPPSTFKYSAYNLDSHGDMLKTESGVFLGVDGGARKPSNICSVTAKQLSSFVQEMKLKKVKVYFANSPYVASKVAINEIRATENQFLQDFKSIGCFIDNREDLIFEKSLFFNSNLHLNSQGRALRTKLFVDSLVNNSSAGNCKHNHS